MEESNNHENESKKLELGWEDYVSLKAAQLLGWKNFMSTSEAELQYKKQKLTLQELLEWKKFIPIGFRFVPTDYELLKYYLLAKVHGGFILPDMGMGFIREADVYQCHPATLPGLDKGEEFCYYFTTRNQRFENSKRPARTTEDGRGNWRMTSKLTPFFEDDGSKLGRKNTLVYHLTKPKGVLSKKDLKTNWIMHEYVLDKTLYNPTRLPSTSSRNQPKQLVLCRIYERKKEAAEAEEKKSQSDQGSRSLQIRDADHDSSDGFEKQESPTKRKQRSMTPAKGTSSSCNHHKSVAHFYQGELSCTDQLPKRSRPSPSIDEDNDSMSLNDYTSTSNTYEASLASPISMHQHEKCRVPVTIQEGKCELTKNFNAENGLLLEDIHKDGGRDHDLEEITHDVGDDGSHIDRIEENESDHIMTSVNEEEDEDEDELLVANAVPEQNSTQIGRIEGGQAGADRMRGDCSSTLTSRPALLRHSSSDLSSDASFIRGDTRQ